jgi:hypothetical protein
LFQGLRLFRIFGQLFLRSIVWQIPAGGLGSLTMNGVRINGVRRLGLLAMLLLSTIPLKADPIVLGEGPPRHEAVVPVILAVLVEAICIRLLLRRWRHPGLFILWLMAMHLFTYPLFLGVLWLSYGSYPAFGVALGEGTIVLVEGGLIYLVCRFFASAKSPLPVPSIAKSLLASLIGNFCSAAAFPLLLLLYVYLASAMGASVLAWD